jgi:glycosyltransferase involved in cell wall biosynthesis
MNPDTTHHRPHISREPISLLLPCFNQAAGLSAIVEGWHKALAKLDRSFEIIIIDDGSTDGTKEIADGLASRHQRVQVGRHDERRGFGTCLRTGVPLAKSPLVAYTSCDYQYAPSDIQKLLQAIDTADLVNGSRTDAMPPALRKLGMVYRGAVRVLFGLPMEPRPGWSGWGDWFRSQRARWVYGVRVRDPHSAFKLFRKSVLERIPIQSDGEFVHVELLAKANFMGCLIAEVPIGRLGGAFKGAAEPAAGEEAKDRRRVFRRPEFGAEAAAGG